jgi:hypothetical protein
MATTEERKGVATLAELHSKVEEIELQARYMEARIRVIEARQKLAKLRQASKIPGEGG